jgi:hypothetical protein
MHSTIISFLPVIYVANYTSIFLKTALGNIQFVGTIIHRILIHPKNVFGMNQYPMNNGPYKIILPVLDGEKFMGSVEAWWWVSGRRGRH